MVFAKEIALSKKDRAFLRLAALAAVQSTCAMQHGAVIVRSGSVLAIGWNKAKNGHIVFGNGELLCCTVHAEMDALRQVASDTTNATMYVARINNHGETRLSKPCESCARALLDAGIKRVVYTS